MTVKTYCITKIRGFLDRWEADAKASMPEVIKEMVEGIQSTLKNDVLRLYGCYFLCLLKWLEVHDGLRFDEERIEYCFHSCVQAKLIKAETAYVNDAIGVLNHILEKTKYTKANFGIKERPPGLSIIALTKPNITHFITQLASGATWDTLDPMRPAASTYSVDSYRTFT